MNNVKGTEELPETPTLDVCTYKLRTNKFSNSCNELSHFLYTALEIFFTLSFFDFTRLEKISGI